MLAALIRTPEVQRLGRIQQYSTPYLTYPSLTQKRLPHVIGTASLALKAWDQLSPQIPDNNLREQLGPAFVAAALLHDVGHGPYSHLYEELSGERHENRTIEIIENPQTAIHQQLNAFDRQNGHPPNTTVRLVVQLLDERQIRLPQIKPFARLVSGLFDLDRADFIQRDYHHLINGQKQLPIESLIEALSIDPKTQKLVLRAEALPHLKQYLLDRSALFEKVIYGHESLSAKRMTRELLSRYQQLSQNNPSGSDRAVRERDPFSDLDFYAVFQPGPVSLATFSRLDDASFLSFIKTCTRHPDPILSSLANDLLNVNIYPALDLSHLPNHQVHQFREALHQAINSQDDIPATQALWWLMENTHRAIKPDSESLLIRFRDGSLLPLSALNNWFTELPKATCLKTLVYHPALEPVVREVGAAFASRDDGKNEEKKAAGKTAQLRKKERNG
ncbi:MAG: hypothetical protein AB7P76_12505 [Candidatus Melainabacteria bacterium]